jgi:hypothetical protein
MKIILIRSDHDFPHQSDYRTVAEPGGAIFSSSIFEMHGQRSE